MKKSRFVKQLLLGASLVLMAVAPLQASEPVWSFTPLTPTTVVVPPTGTAMVKYRVTNHSLRRHTLQMTAIPGVTQVTTPGNCANPFTLNANESCVLNLLVKGSELTAPVVSGPEVCQTGGGKLQCYRPAFGQNLRLTKANIQAYSLGGTISGLKGTVVLQNSNGELLSRSINGSFTFPTSLPTGATYGVTVKTQPNNQVCTVTNGSGTVGSSNVTNIGVNCRVAFAYVGNAGDSTVLRCPFNSNGTLGTCADSGAGAVFNLPWSMAFNPTRTHVYVTNDDDPNTITLCNVTSAGVFTDCRNSGATGFDDADGIIISPNGTRAYVADYIGGQVFVCNVNQATGELTSCAFNGALTFDRPEDLVLSPDGTRIYVTNNTGSTVSICTINQTSGQLTSCSVSAAIFDEPWGITFSPDGSHIYVVNNGNDSVSTCGINAMGQLVNCVASDPVFTGPDDIAFSTNGTKAYVTNGDTVSICAIAPVTGKLINCQPSDQTFDSPLSIAIS